MINQLNTMKKIVEQALKDHLSTKKIDSSYIDRLYTNECIASVLIYNNQII